MSFANELKDFTAGFQVGFHTRDKTKASEAQEAQHAGYNNWSDYQAAGKVRKGGEPGSYDPGAARSTLPSGGAGGGAGGDTSKVDVGNSSERYKFLTEDLGYTPVAAAGVLGNAYQESTWNPVGKAGDKGTAHGEFQWRGDRYTALQNFAADGKRNGTGQVLNPNDWQTQYRYMKHEADALGVSSAMNAAKTPQEAADIFALKFERPKGAETGNANNIDGIGTRRGVAGNVFKQFGSGAVPATSTTAIPTTGAFPNREETQSLAAGPNPVLDPNSPQAQAANAPPPLALGTPEQDTLPAANPDDEDPNSQGYARGGAVGLADGGTAIPTMRSSTQAVAQTPDYVPNATTGWTPRRVGDPQVTGGANDPVNPVLGAQQRFRDALAARAQAANAAATSGTSQAVDPSRFGHQAYLNAQAAWGDRLDPYGRSGYNPPQGSPDVLHPPARSPYSAPFMDETSWQRAQPGYGEWYKSTYGQDAPAAPTRTNTSGYDKWLNHYLAKTYPVANGTATGMSSGGPVVGFADGGPADEMQYDEQGRPIGLPPPTALPVTPPAAAPSGGGVMDMGAPPPAGQDTGGLMDMGTPAPAAPTPAAPPAPAPAPQHHVAGPIPPIDGAGSKRAIGDENKVDKKAQKEAADRLRKRDEEYAKITKTNEDVSTPSGGAGVSREIQLRQAAGPAAPAAPAGPIPPDRPTYTPAGVEPSDRAPPTALPVAAPAPASAPTQPPLIGSPEAAAANDPNQSGAPTPRLPAPVSASPDIPLNQPPPPLPTVQEMEREIHARRPDLPPAAVRQAAAAALQRFQEGGYGPNAPTAPVAPVSPTAVPSYNPRTPSGAAPASARATDLGLVAPPSSAPVNPGAVPSYNPRTPSGAAPTVALPVGAAAAAQLGGTPSAPVPNELPQAPPGQALPPPRPGPGDLGTPTPPAADRPAPGATPTTANPVPTQQTQSKPRTAPLVTTSRTKAPSAKPTRVTPQSNTAPQGATFNDMTPERPGALVKNPQDYKPGGAGRANAGLSVQRATLVKPEETKTSTHAGMKYINDNILSPGRTRAVGTDPAQAQAGDNLNQHALTQGDYDQLAKQVDPEGKLPEAERVLKVQQDMYDFYMSHGYPEKAAQASASVLLYGRRVSQLAGVMAQGAIANGDLVGAGNWMHKAYETLPDGKELRIDGQLTDEGGKPALHYQIIDLDTGKVEHDDTATADDMTGMAKSMASSMEWAKQTTRVAQGQPALYRGGGTSRGGYSRGLGTGTSATAENNARKEAARTALNDAGEAFRQDPSEENRKAAENAMSAAGDVGVAPSAIRFAQKRFGLEPAKAAPTSAGERKTAGITEAGNTRVASLQKDLASEQDPAKKADIQAQIKAAPFDTAYQQNALGVRRALPGKDIKAYIDNLDPESFKGFTANDVSAVARILATGNNIDGGTAADLAYNALNGATLGKNASNQALINNTPVFITYPALKLIMAAQRAKPAAGT